MLLSRSILTTPIIPAMTTPAAIASHKRASAAPELSGWEGDDRWYMTGPDGKVIGTATPRIFKHDREYEAGYRTTVPAYDLGYLLRKLPKKTVIKKVIYSLVLTPSTSDGTWIADYYSGGWAYFNNNRHRDNWLHHGDNAKLTEADIPEDAACKLAIELFKRRVLVRTTA